MNAAIDILLIFLILTNLRLLASSSLLSCIRTVAAQAVLLGLLPVLMLWHSLSEVLFIALLSTALKAVALPHLLRRAARQANVRHEVEPFVGYGLSLILGIALLCVASYLGGQLPLPAENQPRFIIPVALFTMFVGLFVIVSRRKAISQVLGYLAMENGIYTFGIAFAIQEPLVVELGILLDVLVAVFVMGIIIHHINREFDHIDTDRLSALRD